MGGFVSVEMLVVRSQWAAKVGDGEDSLGVGFQSGGGEGGPQEVLPSEGRGGRRAGVGQCGWVVHGFGGGMLRGSFRCLLLFL